MLIQVLAIILAVTSSIYAQQECRLTDPDILGPYYIPGAPKATDKLCENSPAHDRLILIGQVLDFDSNCSRGIPNVRLDLWQVLNKKNANTGFL